MIDPADTLTTALPVTTDSPIRLQFVSDERSYTTVLQRDLLEDWVVVQSWAGKSAVRGGGKVTVVSDREHGIDQLRKITRLRLGQGYTLLD